MRSLLALTQTVQANLAPQFGDPQAMVELRTRLALPMVNSIPQVIAHARGLADAESSDETVFIGEGKHNEFASPWSCWEYVPSL